MHVLIYPLTWPSYVAPHHTLISLYNIFHEKRLTPAFIIFLCLLCLYLLSYLAHNTRHLCAQYVPSRLLMLQLYHKLIDFATPFKIPIDILPLQKNFENKFCSGFVRLIAVSERRDEACPPSKLMDHFISCRTSTPQTTVKVNTYVFRRFAVTGSELFQISCS